MGIAREPRCPEPELGDGGGDLAQQVRGLRLVHELAVALHAPMDPAPLLELVLDVVIQLHDARHGILYLYRGGVLEIATARGLDGISAAARRQLAQRVHAVAHERHVVLDTELDPSHHELVEVSRRMGVRAIHRTPIRARGGRLFGVVAVHLPEPRGPTALEIQLADLCARHAADALERCETIGQLGRAKEAAEHANRCKDELVAMVSHELRGPLAAVSCALELLAPGATEPQLHTVRAIIARQVGHLTRLVGDLLDAARIARGRLEVERTPMEVGDAIARGVELAAPTCARKRQTVVVSAPRGLLVRGDLTRLTQVIANLVVNAAKYSEPDTRVTVTAHSRAGAIEIAVRDQGVGIAPDMLAHVFEPYTQEQRARAYAQGGLGLGLAIVREVVELHDGEVHVESAGIGQGCTFRVVLPALQPTAAGARGAHATRRILVADQSVAVAAMLAELLRELGHVVCTAHDGVAAIVLARAFAPDVALIDVGLAALDDGSLADRLRPHAGTCPRLIAVTRYRRPIDATAIHRAGFDAHLAKPLSIGALLRTVEGAPP